MRRLIVGITSVVFRPILLPRSDTSPLSAIRERLSVLCAHDFKRLGRVKMGSLGRGLGLALAAMVVAAVGGASSDSALLGVDGRANANTSVAAHQRFVAVVWSATDADGATDIYAAVSRDAGR